MPSENDIQLCGDKDTLLFFNQSTGKKNIHIYIPRCSNTRAERAAATVRGAAGAVLSDSASTLPGIECQENHCTSVDRAACPCDQGQIVSKSLTTGGLPYTRLPCGWLPREATNSSFPFSQKLPLFTASPRKPRGRGRKKEDEIKRK